MGSTFSQQKKCSFKTINCDDEKIEFDDEVDSINSNNQAQMILESQEFLNTNPGPFEELQKVIRDVSPNPIEGLKVVSNLPINDNMQVALNWSYSNEASTKFYPTLNFAGEKQIRSFERTPMGAIEVDGDKNFGLSLIHYLSKDIRLKMQLHNKGFNVENVEYNFTYFGKSYTASGSIINPSPSSGSCVFVTQFLKRLTSKIDIGTEIAIQLLNGRPNLFVPTFAVKYTHGINPHHGKNGNGGILSNLNIEPKGSALALVGSKLVHLSYHRYVAPGLQFLSTYDYSPDGPIPNLTSFGYLYNLHKLGMNVRASFDSTMTVQSVVEKNFTHADSGWGFLVSLAHNFPSNRTITGIGLTIGK